MMQIFDSQNYGYVMDMSLVKICHITHFFSYSKQRNCVSTNIIVIKYLPIALAVLLVNIILRVKPVEQEISRSESQASSPEASESISTSTYLYTIAGVCVEPSKMSKLLAATFTEHGFEIQLHDLRHALEAFSHKLSLYIEIPESGCGSHPISLDCD